MAKKKIAEAVTVKRENRNHKYVSVARKNGKVVSQLPWKGKETTEYMRYVSETPKQERETFYEEQSHYIYVVKATEKDGRKFRGLTISSRFKLYMPRGSKLRKQLYEAIREKYNQYSFKIGSLQLVSTYSTYGSDKGKRIYSSR